MNAFKKAAYAVLRRFIVIAATALLAYAANEATGWLKAAGEGHPEAAGWLPMVYFLIEFVQKYIRERKAE